MAAKRIAQTTFNWAALAERVPEHQTAQYLAFKSKSDNYIRRMMALPEQPPKIDWEFYGKTVPIPGLVEEFKKKYESFQIPVPSVDSYYSQLADMEKSMTEEINTFKSESAKRIVDYEEEIKKQKALIPHEMMTLEEVEIHSPELGVNREVIWPPNIEVAPRDGH